MEYLIFIYNNVCGCSNVYHCISLYISKLNIYSLFPKIEAYLTLNIQNFDMWDFLYVTFWSFVIKISVHYFLGSHNGH